MSLEVPVSKAGLTQNGDEACRLLQGHDAPQNKGVPLLGIRLPVLRNFAGKKLRRIWQDRMSARCVDPQKGRSSRFYTAETAAGGKLRRFVTQGRTACRNGALIPSRSGYGMRRLLLNHA